MAANENAFNPKKLIVLSKLNFRKKIEFYDLMGLKGKERKGGVVYSLA